MCSRCLAYGVQIALRRVKKSGSFLARAAIFATLLAREGIVLFPFWHAGRQGALPRQSLFSSRRLVALAQRPYGVSVLFFRSSLVYERSFSLKRRVVDEVYFQWATNIKQDAY
jgi:hypothetical protein